MKIAVGQLLSLLLFIIGLSVYADETSLEGAYIWTLKSPDGNEFVEKIYFKNMGLHGNLWVNQREIHQNPSSVKRQSGITAPVGRFYSVCRLTAART